MGAAWEVSTEVGGGDVRLGKVLLRVSSGGAVVWGGEMGDIGANGTEVRGSACGFPAIDKNSKSKRLRDGSWRKATAKKVLQRADTQPLQTYVDRRQATVSEWVALRPIFDICVRDTGYEL